LDSNDLIPNGWAELDYKINNIPNAFDASNTYYLPNEHNLGLLLDGSGHFLGGTTPPNLLNGSDDSTGVGYALAGLQYKYHTSSLSPFFRGFLGAANISPDCCHGTVWSFAAGGGGGLDYKVKPRFSIRLIQADYIYSQYPHVFPSTHPTQWNSVRLAFGVVFNIGNYCTPRPLSCTASATPAEVFAGEPVNVSAAGTNFDPKHALTYGWSATGGKLASNTTQSTQIDTTGLGPGTYSAKATITDPKIKGSNSAPCPAAFVVKPPPQPPVVSCVANPTRIDPGQTSTITMTASSPDQRPLTFRWTYSVGQLSGSGNTAVITATNNDAGSTIAVTGTATDDRNLSANCNGQVTVAKLPPPCVKLQDWGECTFEKDPKRPWRVDNDCKDTLDKLALRLQQTPNGKLVIVGYTDESEAAAGQTLGAQRAVNAEYYLTSDGPNKIDATRLQARQGGIKAKATHFSFVPDGDLCSGQPDLGTPVDETKIKGQTRTQPAHHEMKAPTAPRAQ